MGIIILPSCVRSTIELVATYNTNARSRCSPCLGLTFGKDLHTFTLSNILPLGCKKDHQTKRVVCLPHQTPNSIICPVYYTRVLQINTWLREALYPCIIYTLYILGFNSSEAEWRICLISFTKKHLISHTTAANKECLRSPSSASYRRHLRRGAHSISDHQRSARLPSRYTFYAFYPYTSTIKVHENKSSWWDQTLRLTLWTYPLYCTSYNCSFHFFLDQIPWLQQHTFAITTLPAYSHDHSLTRMHAQCSCHISSLKSMSLVSPSPWVRHVTAASRTCVIVLPRY